MLLMLKGKVCGIGAWDDHIRPQTLAERKELEWSRDKRDHCFLPSHFASTGSLLSDIHETESGAFKYMPCGSQCLLTNWPGVKLSPQGMTYSVWDCSSCVCVCMCVHVLGQRGLEVIYFYIFRRNTKRVRERERKGVKVKVSMIWIFLLLLLHLT